MISPQLLQLVSKEAIEANGAGKKAPRRETRSR
jgi:hypothetical protein